MLRAILFDLDDTLFNSTELSIRSRKAATEAMVNAGLRCSQEEAYKRLERIVERYGSNYGHHFDRLVEEVNGEWNARIVASGVVAHHSIRYSYLTLHPYPGTNKTLLKLRQLGMLLGVVTNGKAVKQWEKLICLGIADFFDTIVTSEEVGVEKPDPKLYLACLERLGCEPSEALYVGDREDEIVGAKRVGLKTVRIRKGKHADETWGTSPDLEVREFPEILEVVKKVRGEV